MKINDGELLVELKADLTGLREGLNQANSTLNSFKSSISSLEKAIEGQTSSISQSMQSMTSGFSNGVNQMVSSNARIENMLSGIVKSFSEMNRGVSTELNSMQGSINGVPATLANVSNRVSSTNANITRQFKSLKDSISLEVAGINNAINGIGSGVGAGSLGARLRGLQSANTAGLNRLFDAVTQQTIKLDSAIKVLGTNMSSSMSAGKKSTQELANELERAERSSRSFGTSLKQIAINTYILHAFGEFIGSTLQSIFSPGIKFAGEMENIELGLAGMITSMSQLNGEDVKFNDSLAMSATLMERIKKDAVVTALTAGELAKVFQSIFAPGMNAGLTPDQIEQVAVIGSNAVRTIGLPAQQVVQELRAILGGEAIRPGVDMLASVLGYNTQILNSLKSQGKLYDDLMERMKGFQMATQLYADTWEGITSNLKDGLEQTTAQGFRPLFNYLKGELKTISEQFYTIKKEIVTDDNGNAVKDAEGNDKTRPDVQYNQQTIEALKEVSRLTIGIADGFKRILVDLMPLWKDLAAVLDVIGRVFIVILGLVDYFAAGLGAIIDLIPNLLSLFGDMAGVVAGLTVVVLGLVATIGLIPTAIVLIITALGLVVKHWEIFSTLITAGCSYIANSFKIMGNTIVEIWTVVISALQYKFADFLQSVSDNVKIPGVQDKFKGWADSVRGWADNNRDYAGSLKAINTELGGEMQANSATMSVAFGQIGEAIRNDLIVPMQRFGDLSKAQKDPTGLKAKYPIEPKEKAGKKGAIGNAQQGLEDAIIDAERKDEVEKLKAYLKELDYLYSQHEISIGEYYEKYRKTEQDIFNVEAGAIKDKIALADAEAVYLKGLGDEAGALKKQTEAVKLNGDLMQKESQLKEKLIDLDRKEATAIRNLEKDMAKLNAEYEKRIGHLGKAGEIEAQEKWDEKFKQYSVEYDWLMKVKQAQGSLSEVDTAKAEALRNSINMIVQSEGMDIAKGHYDELKNRYDTLTKDMSLAVDEVNLKVDKGLLSDFEGTKKVLDLKKDYYSKMKELLPLMEKWADITKDPSLIQNIKQMRMELEKNSTVVNEDIKNVKSNMQSAFEEFFKNTDKLGSAFKNLFKSILENIQSLIAKDLATKTMNVIGGGITSFITNIGDGWKGNQYSKNSGINRQSSYTSLIPAGINSLNFGNKQTDLKSSLTPIFNQTKQALTGFDGSIKSSTLFQKDFGIQTKVTQGVIKGAELATKAGTIAKQAGTTTEQSASMTLRTSFIILADSAKVAAKALKSMSNKKGGSSSGDESSSGMPDFFSGILSSFFADGGEVSGSGTSTSDSIPAMLSNGEFVVRASTVKKYGAGFFNALNSGKLPTLKFAEGGAVTGGTSSSNASSTSGSTQQVSINYSPVFQSLDPAENMRQFEKQFPLFKQKMLEAISTEPSTRNVIKKVGK